MSRYSMDRKEKKIAGVCSTLGDVFNIDPTILRIGFIASIFLISWQFALIAYGVAFVYLHKQKGHVLGRRGQRRSEFDRMADAGRTRSSIHALRTELDETDRRMMAIDHHITTSKNHELAREIEALREDK